MSLFLGQEFSKDPRTKVGAIIVNGEDFSPRTFGYNGLPRKCNDYVEERLAEPEKYFWFSHAERNAIDNAARVGIPIDGCIMFVTVLPCMDCARSIIQAGIKCVVTKRPSEEVRQRWGESFIRTETIFKECGIELIILDEKDIGNTNVSLS